MSHRVLASALTAALLFTASSAHADPADGFRLGAGLASGLMLNADGTGARGGVNPQQLGFRGMMGYSFRGGFYIGGSMKIFLGQKLTVDLPDPLADFEQTFMTQQFALDLGYAIGVNDQLSVRPMLELALNRYGIQSEGPGIDESESDVGLMMNPGLDLVADVSDHLWLGGGLRVAFALMGDEDEDIHVAENAADISLQFTVDAGLRF